jgi:(p)ppGpp synthase/HD superfamily hydrolase
MARMNTGMARIAAVLHDVLKDTETTAEDLLRAGMPAEAV